MFLVVNFAAAQKYSMGVGVAGTFNWASFRDKDQKDTFDVKPSTGCAIAGLIGFPLKNNYSVIIEGGFSQKGRVLREKGIINNHGTYRFVDGAMLYRLTKSVKLIPCS